MTAAAKFDIRANDKTKLAFDSVSKKLKRLSVVAGKTVIAVGAVAGTALAGLAFSSAKSADALAKQADKIGITTEKLATLHYMTEQYTNAGVGAMSEALTKAEKRLGEFAANGGGAAAIWLKSFNLDIKQLQSLTPDQLFQTYAESIRGLSSRGEKLAAISALMGDESRSLISIIDAGPEAFRNAEKEAKAFGLTLSRIEVAKIEAAGDALDKVQQVFKGVGNKLAVKFSAYVEEIANQFNNAAISSNGFVDTIESGMKTAITSVAYLGDVIRGLEVVVKMIEIAFSGFGELVIGTIFTIADGWRQLANLIPGLDIAPMETFAAITQAAGEQTKKLTQELAALVEQPMPSEHIEAFFKSVEERSTAAAVKVADALKLTQGGQVDGPVITFDKGADLDRLRNKYTSQLDLLNESLQTEFALIDAAEQAKRLKVGEYESLNLAAAQHYEEKRAKLKQKALGNEIKRGEAAFSQMISAAASSNKTFFQILKVYELSKLAMKAPAAIADAYAWGTSWGGPPAGATMAGITGAAMGVYATDLAGSSYGGGVSVSQPGGSTSVSPAPKPDLLGSSGNTNQSNQSEPKNINITIEGNPSKQQVRDLMDAIGEEIKDGYNLSVTIA